jgi:RHS repeat-associated protein
MITELNAGTGAILRRYVWGPGTDEPVVQYEGSGTTDRRWLHADERGSVTAITDAAGDPIHINSYDEYGIPGGTVSGNTFTSTNLGRFQYTGQTYLPELGLYHYKARMYSFQLGRFMQPDPIGYGDGLNMYAYVGNNPVNRTDPSGKAYVCTDAPGSAIAACILVDGDGDGNARERDLTRSQSQLISSNYRDAIIANNGRDISGFGKIVKNDSEHPASHNEFTMTRVATQFIGATAKGKAAQLWSNVDAVWVQGAHYFGRPNEFVPDALTSPRHGQIVLGRDPGWLSGSLYNRPSDLARVLLHEMGHSAEPLVNHINVDSNARMWLKEYGLNGGGCSPVGLGGTFGIGFPGC